MIQWQFLSNEEKAVFNEKAKSLRHDPLSPGIYTYRLYIASQVFDATLVGTYKAKDLAVVKIEAAPSLLRPLPLGTHRPPSDLL